MILSRALQTLSSALYLGLVVGLGCLVACSDPSSGGGGGTETPSTTGEGAGTPCSSSAECNGQLCIVELCRPCTEDSFCADDPAYGVGATCGADGACASCLGQEGCGCDAGTCQDGLVCEGDLCAPEPACTAGDLGCPCFENQTCNADLRCNADASACEPCPPGEQGCGCQEGDLCADGLACLENLCVTQECTLGALECPCREDEQDRCDEGLTCSDGGMYAECPSDVEGCPCDEEGASQNDLVCDDEEQTCRVPLTCDDLPCVPNQQCQTDEPGVDAVCLEACVDGFTYNTNTDACDPIPEANCRPGAPASVLADCTMLNRECVEELGSARCGACLANFLDGVVPMGACRPVVTCDGLACGEDNRACTPHSSTSDAICAACLEGFEEQEDGTCAPPMMAHPNCQPGAEMSILDQCTRQNRICTEQGQLAGCGDCLMGYTEDNGGDCVPPDPCEALNCAARSRLCDRDNAQCGACIEGYVDDPSNGANCIPSVDPCEVLGCADQGRVCEGEPVACTDCLEGLVPVADNPESGCREVLTCLDITCDPGTFCTEFEGVDASCSGVPCTDINGDPRIDQAFRRDTGECVDCGLTCDAAGLTGQIWPFTLTNSSRCICETLPGFYLDTGGAFVARPCDGDDDGWVRSSARSALDSQDEVLRTNARCDLKRIDRMVLENEYQQQFEVKLCVEGLVGGFACETNDDCEVGRCDSGVCDCIEANPVELYESVRNDDQDELDTASSTDLPMYRDGARGRRLQATELNPLTRACVSVTADHNDNGIADMSEYQGLQTQGASNSEQIFTDFSYFIELAEGSYMHDLGEEYGHYLIRESSRCDAFPVLTDEAIDGPYWRSCTRNRDAQFDRMNEQPLIGYDFGAWNCSDELGECAPPPPLTNITPDDQVPPHGLCDEGITLPPLDGVWRGMNHHSQFKCIEIVNTVPPDRDMARPQLRTRDELADANGVSGLYQLNACAIACPEGDLDCTADCEGGPCLNSSTGEMANPDLPVVVCRTVAREQALEGQVGFAAMRYSSTDSYTRGCINEWRHWKRLCPGYLASLEGQLGPISGAPGEAQIQGAGNPGNFGKLVCGCGFNYGGPECDLGCPGAPTECQGQECATNQVFYGGTNTGGTCANGYCPVAPDGEGGGRRGWWACGSWDTTSYETEIEVGPQLIDDSGWSASGTVPKDGIGKRPLCQTVDDCASGWAAH